MICQVEFREGPWCACGYRAGGGLPQRGHRPSWRDDNSLPGITLRLYSFSHRGFVSSNTCFARVAGASVVGSAGAARNVQLPKTRVPPRPRGGRGEGSIDETRIVSRNPAERRSGCAGGPADHANTPGRTDRHEGAAEGRSTQSRNGAKSLREGQGEAWRSWPAAGRRDKLSQCTCRGP